MDFEQEAKNLFVGPYNCAQAVLGAFADHFGLDRATAFRVATPFGGGIGHSGRMCGAVSGALMTLGLARGVSVYAPEEKEACYALTRTFLNRFSAQHGSVDCPVLLGVDISNPEVLEEARQQGVFDTVCPAFIGDAATMAAEVLGIE
ncbi:MAG: C-GCAxxG-C-C family protein [Brevefilum sp.]